MLIHSGYFLAGLRGGGLVGLISLLFGFSGRINRVQYWLGCVIAGVGGAMLFFMLAIMTMPQGGVPKGELEALHALSSMGVAIGMPFILMIWSGSALQTKRLHDRGRSGLWALAPIVPLTMILVSIVSVVATGGHPEQALGSMMLWVVLLQVVNLVMFVEVGCMAGKAEANKYGPPSGGGFSGGGAPTGGAPIPGKAKPAAQTIPGMGSTLSGAESAIERAIAAQSKQQQRQPATAPRTFATAPAASSGLRPATASGAFGRKAQS